jgi:hypothetical protein
LGQRGDVFVVGTRSDCAQDLSSFGKRQCHADILGHMA